MTTLHNSLMILQCVFATFIFLSENAVHSVIFLILTFCCSACVLIFFTADFLALIFIVIYVGAIAILFLFVVMMLNVKESSNSFNSFSNITEIIIISLLFGMWIDGFTSPDIIFKLDENLDGFSNLQSLGQFLYNYFLSGVLISGLVLLVAVIGAITLTFNFNSSRKNQIVSRQLSRSVEVTHFFN
jgi:NADH-quinone oxidoreductase subunit J